MRRTALVLLAALSAVARPAGGADGSGGGTDAGPGDAATPVTGGGLALVGVALLVAGRSLRR